MITQEKEKALNSQVELDLIQWIRNTKGAENVTYFGGIHPYDCDLKQKNKTYHIEVKERIEQSLEDIDRWGGELLVDYDKFERIGPYILMQVFNQGIITCSYIDENTKVDKRKCRKNQWTTDKVWKDVNLAKYKIIGNLYN